MKADQEVAIADVQRQVVAVRSGETVPMSSPVGESQINGRTENEAQRVQGLIRKLVGALEQRSNTRVRPSDPMFPWMVEWSAGLITRYVNGKTSRTAFSEARGHDAQATVAEFGEKIMYLTPRNKNKSGPKVEAKFYDGMWLGLRMKSDEGSDQSKDCEEAPRGSKDGALTKC